MGIKKRVVIFSIMLCLMVTCFITGVWALLSPNFLVEGEIIYIADMPLEAEENLTYSFDDSTMTATVTGYKSAVANETIPEKVRRTSDNLIYTVTAIGESAFLDNTTLSNINLASTLKTINATAFSGCSALTSFTIPKSVTYLGEKAFNNCTSIKDIYIYVGLNNVGANAFVNCTGIENVYVDDIDAWSMVELPSADATCKANPLYYAEHMYEIGNSTEITNLVIDSATKIGAHAYYHALFLKSVTIGDSVETIGAWSFGGCSNVTKVIIGNGVTTIKYGAFGSNINLSDLTIGNNVETIEFQAFENNKIVQLILPSSVTNIGQYAFRSCSKLTIIYSYAATPPTINTTSVFTINEGLKIYVPAESVSSYKSSWTTYANYIYAASTTDGLQLWFDGIYNSQLYGATDTSATKWVDLAGDNDGTLTNFSSGVWTGNGLKFDGSNDYVVGSNMTISNTTTWEIVFTANSSSMYLLDQRINEVGYQPAYFRDGNIQFYDSVTNDTTYKTCGIVEGDQTTVTIVKNGSTVSIYVNGVLKGSKTTSITSSTQGSLYLGARHVSQSAYFNGTMHALRIYNRALSATEVAANSTYNADRYA